MTLRYTTGFALAAILTSTPAPAASIETQLAAVPDKLICEGYENDNWELFVMKANGSELRNLTNTPDIHELYPQVSPDGQFLTVSTGTSGQGDPSKPGTHTAACEVVGVYADNWNIVAVSFEPDTKVDLMNPQADDFLQLTTNGKSYKESEWIPVKR